jgi:2'-5' RNA ligase
MGGAPSIRTFLAIELPESQKTRFTALERDFVEHASILKWVTPSLLHITVRFLGGVPGPQLASVEEAARRSSSGIEPFVLQCAGLGAFPSERVPRVLWVGLRDDTGMASFGQLFARLEHELAERGFKSDERGFSPHLTLARVRDGASTADRRLLGDTLARIRAARQINARFEVHNLTVMRSDLGRNGPAYTPVSLAPLGQAGSLDPHAVPD